MPGIAHGSSKTKEMENNISLCSYVDEICDCTLNKTQPYNCNKNGGTTNNLNTLLALYMLLKNKLFLNLRHTNSSISQSKTMEDKSLVKSCPWKPGGLGKTNYIAFC